MLTISLITCIAVALSIGIHYTVLITTPRILEHFHGKHPASIVLTLFLAVLAHLLEIFVFAIAWYLMQSTQLIQFSPPALQFIDLLYFSGTTYTTVGYGDIVITGDGRIAAVIEGVMGLVLIAWTASFTYYEMNRKWIKQR